jgi:hypothetical protein
MARTIAGGLGQQAVILWLKENRIDVVPVGVQYTVRLARDANYAA